MGSWSISCRDIKCYNGNMAVHIRSYICTCHAKWADIGSAQLWHGWILFHTYWKQIFYATLIMSSQTVCGMVPLEAKETGVVKHVYNMDLFVPAFSSSVSFFQRCTCHKQDCSSHPASMASMKVLDSFCIYHIHLVMPKMISIISFLLIYPRMFLAPEAGMFQNGLNVSSEDQSQWCQITVQQG